MTGSSDADALFREWLARRAAGADESIEVLQRTHPRFADELRRLFGAWQLLEGNEPDLAPADSLTDRLRTRFGRDVDPRVDLVELATSGRFVEIGRLMIRAPWRSRPAVVLSLMRAALAEVVGRGYTHLFTVVFEDDPHSPLGFHTRRLGFERVGTHRSGELACASRRILLVLDLARSYRRLAAAGSPLVAHLARGIEDRLSALG